MSISFKPNGDRVLIDKSATPDISKGGLHIPDEAKAKPCTGRIVAVGPGDGCHNCGTVKPMPEVGMFVIFPEGAGVDVMIGDKEYRIIRAMDIHGDDPTQFQKPEE